MTNKWTNGIGTMGIVRWMNVYGERGTMERLEQ
jgi:hypothetical protein